jgi:NTP pyrophosphatase (non-canonical NTP hydrolase)
MAARLVTKNNYKTCSIDAWVEDTGKVWLWDTDRSISDLYYHVVMHASNLGEALRRELYDEAAGHLGQTTIWLLSFVNKLKTSTKGMDRIFNIDKNLSDIIWSKYPYACPVCYGQKVALPKLRGRTPEEWDGELHVCECLQTLADVEVRNEKLDKETKRYNVEEITKYAMEHRRDDDDAFSLDWLQRMYREIYSANLFVTDIEDIGFHLLEEVGEIAESIRGLYTYNSRKEVTLENRALKLRDLENEIADTFSWIFTLSNKLIDTINLAERVVKLQAPMFSFEIEKAYMLSEILWKDYGLLGELCCKDCLKNVCSCPIYMLNEADFKELLHTLYKETETPIIDKKAKAEPVRRPKSGVSKRAISRTDVDVMRFINTNGPVSLREIAYEMRKGEHSMRAVSKALDALLKKGLLITYVEEDVVYYSRRR